MVPAIGTGSQAGHMHDAEEVQFVALCDVDTNNLQKAKGEQPTPTMIRTYGEAFREFLEKEKLDAVTIALPDHWHGCL